MSTTSINDARDEMHEKTFRAWCNKYLVRRRVCAFVLWLACRSPQFRAQRHRDIKIEANLVDGLKSGVSDAQSISSFLCFLRSSSLCTFARRSAALTACAQVNFILLVEMITGKAITQKYFRQPSMPVRARARPAPQRRRLLCEKLCARLRQRPLARARALAKEKISVFGLARATAAVAWLAQLRCAGRSPVWLGMAGLHAQRGVAADPLD